MTQLMGCAANCYRTFRAGPLGVTFFTAGSGLWLDIKHLVSGLADFYLAAIRYNLLKLAAGAPDLRFGGGKGFSGYFGDMLVVHEFYIGEE